MDSYGLSKVLNEKTARAFAMRYADQTEADYQALVDYIVMLTVVRDRILAMIDDGKSLEEIEDLLEKVEDEEHVLARVDGGAPG